jgi:hypothetical protein
MRGKIVCGQIRSITTVAVHLAIVVALVRAQPQKPKFVTSEPYKARCATSKASAVVLGYRSRG